MKTIIVGKLTNIEPIQDKGSYKSQRIRIEVQEYDSTTGEPKKHEIFEPVIFNKMIDSINALNFKDKRVRATCWLRSLESSKDEKTFYNIALNCSEIKEA